MDNNSNKKNNRGYSTKYDTKKRFASFWHQIDEARKVNPKSILEIGTGSGFVNNYLKRYFNVISLDISPELCPDCVASVKTLPFSDNAFEVALCCQVLEHIPFTFFSQCLKELRRVTSNRLIISLPDKRKHYPIQLPKLGKKAFSNPFHKFKVHEFDGEHHWEVNALDTELYKVVEEIESAGMVIESTYQVFENFKHRFFIINSA